MQLVLLFRDPLHISPINNNNQLKIVVKSSFFQARPQSVVPIFIYFFLMKKLTRKITGMNNANPVSSTEVFTATKVGNVHRLQ